MSIFKTQWIVLQVWKYSDNELFYKVFFKDYGILTVKKRKKTREKPVDIGYLISCEILTHSEKAIHTIGSIKIISFFDTKQRLYNEIEGFLKLLVQVKKEIPEWSPHFEIFDILFWAINNQDKLKSQKILLTHLKIISCLWNLSDEHQDITCQKILKFIHSHSYKDIFRLWDIPEDIVRQLEEIIW